MNGTLDFCDNMGGVMDLNTGTIAGTIAFCSSGCFVGAAEQEMDYLLLLQIQLTLESKNTYYVVVYSML